MVEMNVSLQMASELWRLFSQSTFSGLDNSRFCLLLFWNEIC